MYFELRLILVVLSCYRLARMIALDDGPLFIFENLRDTMQSKANNEDNPAGLWHNLSEGLSCPYCVGIWLSLPLLALLIWHTVYGDWFLVLLAISGGQAFMQSQDRK
jgi:hypothetical protein